MAIGRVKKIYISVFISFGVWVISPTLAIAGTSFSFGYDEVSGYKISSSPITPDAYTSLALVASYMQDLKAIYEFFDTVPQKVARDIAMKKSGQIEEACHTCPQPEFRKILEDKVINGLVPFVAELLRNGKNGRSGILWQELENRVEKLKTEYKKVGGVVRCFSTSMALK